MNKKDEFKTSFQDVVSYVYSHEKRFTYALLFYVLGEIFRGGGCGRWGEGIQNRITDFENSVIRSVFHSYRAL